MKKNLLWLSIFVFLVTGVFSQSIKIVPKPFAYQRQVGEGFNHKKEFSVIYPSLISTNKNLKSKIEQQISYWNNFKTSLKEAKEDFYIDELSYNVNYNKNNILDITLTQEGSGAYPWTEKRFLVLDLRNGNLVRINEVFEKQSVGNVEKLIRRAMRREIKKADMEPETALSFKQSLKLENVKFSDLEGFSISDKGLTFLFDYDFNFAGLAEEPSGKYFFTWKVLKTYIKKDGLFARFVK